MIAVLCANQRHRKEVQTLLEENGCQTTDQVLTNLEPFFSIVENQSFTFARTEELNQQAIADAVSEVMDRKVCAVQFIQSTMHYPWSRPYYMDREVHDKQFATPQMLNLGVIFCEKFQDIFWQFYQPKADAALCSKGLKPIPACSFTFTLRNILEKQLTQSLGQSLTWEYLNGLANFSLKEAVNLYLTFALLNDSERVAQFEPLVKIMANCIPFGFQHKNPQTVLVLAESLD